MELRRVLATSTAILALAAPLTACGFDYATDREYTPAAGANDSSGVLKVLSAVVVSGEEGSGTFIASLSNSSLKDEQTLTSVAGGGSDTIETSDFKPVEVGPGELVNLAEPPADVTLTGDFSSGDFVTLTIDFESGQRTVMNVPVVSDDFGPWEGMDAS